MDKAASQVSSEAQLKPEDLKPGDILRAPNGELWNVDYVFPEKLVLYRRIDVFDLEGWKPVDSYHITGGKEKPSK